MTLKRRAEISADIFARLLRYFFLSCKNLTVIKDSRIADKIIKRILSQTQKRAISERVKLTKEGVDHYAKDGRPGMVCPSCSFYHDPLRY